MRAKANYEILLIFEVFLIEILKLDELLLRRQFHSGPRETGAGGAFDSGAKLRDSIA